MTKFGHELKVVSPEEAAPQQSGRLPSSEDVQDLDMTESMTDPAPQPTQGLAAGGDIGTLPQRPAVSIVSGEIAQQQVCPTAWPLNSELI